MIDHRTHDRVEDLLGAYALDAVDPDERYLVDRHLEECSSCRLEVAEHREVAALLAGEARTVPDHILPAIAAGLDRSTASPVVVPATRMPGPGTVPMRTVMLAAAAVFVVVAALGGVALAQLVRIDDLTTRLEEQQREITGLVSAAASDPLRRAATAALSAPDSRVAKLTSTDASGSMVIVVQPDGTGYVLAGMLEPLPPDATYQLWAVIDGKVISAGVLGARPDVVPFHIDPEGLEGLVITREVAGGVPQSTSDPVVAWFDA